MQLRACGIATAALLAPVAGWCGDSPSLQGQVLFLPRVDTPEQVGQTLTAAVVRGGGGAAAGALHGDRPPPHASGALAPGCIGALPRESVRDARVLRPAEICWRDDSQRDDDGVDWKVAAVRIHLPDAGVGVIVQRLHFSSVAEKGASP